MAGPVPFGEGGKRIADGTFAPVSHPDGTGWLIQEVRSRGWSRRGDLNP